MTCSPFLTHAEPLIYFSKILSVYGIKYPLDGDISYTTDREYDLQWKCYLTSETRGRCLIVFVGIYGFVMLCKKWNNVCTLVTNCLCGHSRFIFVFISLTLSYFNVPMYPSTCTWTSSQTLSDKWRCAWLQYSSDSKSTCPIHGGPSEAGDCSHPPPKMATA